MKIITSLILFLVVTFTNQAQTIWSEDFENWEVLEADYEQPTNWFSSNTLQLIFSDPANVIKSTDAHSGNFAAALIVPPSSFSTPYPGFIQKTIPITEKPYYFTGWHKSDLNQDTVQLLSAIFSWDVSGDTSILVGGSFLQLSETLNNYTYFSSPLFFDNESIPDTARIILSYSDILASLSSSYTIDQIALQATSSTLDLERSEIPVYPNPSQGRFNIYLPNTSGVLLVTDLSGRTIQSIKQQAGQRISSLDISDQVNGIYIATFTGNDGKISRQKLIVTDL